MYVAIHVQGQLNYVSKQLPHCMPSHALIIDGTVLWHCAVALSCGTVVLLGPRDASSVSCYTKDSVCPFKLTVHADKIKVFITYNSQGRRQDTTTGSKTVPLGSFICLETASSVHQSSNGLS